MTEPKNIQKDKPTEQQQPSDETQAEYREISEEEKEYLYEGLKKKTLAKPHEISEEELKQILEDHKKWVESDGKEGDKASFQNANLEGKSGHRANFEKLNLQGVTFRNAKLTNADFRKANLTVADFQNAQLRGVNFEKAILINAHLEEAECQDANFRKAKLSNAHFADAKMNRVNLQKADLSFVDALNTAEKQHSDLRGSIGLLGNEFAQADLTGTKLPEKIEEFKALETVKETSQNARKIFFAMLLGCVYSWLTIATTTDVRLLTNTASSPLPIIGTEIPIAWFYIAAPLVLICLYFYFHLYLDNLWKGLASLPAIFPDGKPLDQTAYPWLLNSIVCRHFKSLKKRPVISHMKEWITIFLAWWVVPITMIYFWIRFIPRHYWKGTIFHIGLIVVSVAFAIIFYRLCALTLKGKEKTVFRLQNFWGDRRFYYSVSVLLIAGLFSLLSYGAINGSGLKEHLTLEEGKVNFFRIKEIIPWAFNIIGYNVFADFQDKDVSEKPDNYWEIEKEDRLESVKGAPLIGRNLKNANMNKAFLVNAYLMGAFLNGANLYNAKLQQANFYNANLQKAKLEFAILSRARLRRANLQQANLWKANLQQADLRYANLQQANLYNANLQEAHFVSAKLQQANLYNANLQQANLRHANLQLAYLESAKLQHADLGSANLQQANLRHANLQLAYLGSANLKEANLKGAKLQQADLGSANLQQADLGSANLKEANLKFANLKEADLYNANLKEANLSTANLQKASLWGANLQEANLEFANLQKANLRSANLQKANLWYADLIGAKKLTIDQLSKVKTLYNTKLDPELMEQVKKCCPQLLEKPKEEKDKTN